MLKTGSEHILTSAQLICNTKQNYFFLHKTGSATTSSFASAIKDKKKKGTQWQYSLSYFSPSYELIHMFHSALLGLHLSA